MLDVSEADGFNSAMIFFAVVLLGLIQGVTEFLPVSSTGHLILADELTGFESALGSKQHVFVFEIFIQLGAILAIVAEYGRPILRSAREAAAVGWKLPKIFVAMVVGTLPLVVVGLLFGSQVEDVLFNPHTVAWAFIVGGILMWVIESVRLPMRCSDTFAVGWRTALVVGAAQALAVIPGTSRSGATIMGGLLAGLDRRTATEFSFLLAFPALLAATLYSLVKHREVIDLTMWHVLLTGLVVSFLCSWAVIRWLLGFVRQYSFKVFAVYRVVFGTVLLIILGR